MSDEFDDIVRNLNADALRIFVSDAEAKARAATLQEVLAMIERKWSRDSDYAEHGSYDAALFWVINRIRAMLEEK